MCKYIRTVYQLYSSHTRRVVSYVWEARVEQLWRPARRLSRGGVRAVEKGK